MLYIAGIILIMAGIAQLVRYIIKSRRPHIEAVIEQITDEYHEKDTQKIKKHPHAYIRYSYRGNDYEKKVHIMKRNAQVGEKIILAVNDKNPEKVEMYHARNEMLTGFGIILLGVAFVAIAQFLIDKWR